MKKEKLIENKSSYRLLLAFIMIILIIVSLCVFLVQKGNVIEDNEVNKYLSEISSQTSHKVNERIQLNIDKLTMISKTLQMMDVEDPQEYIENILNSTSFEWIYVVSEDGMVVFKDGEEKNYGQEEVIQKAIHGTRGMGTRLVKGFHESKGALYAVPYEKNGQKLAIAGWIARDTMSLLMDTDTFNGMGFSHIVLEDGTFIIRSENENAVDRGDNFFYMIETEGRVMDGYSMDKVREDMKNGITGEFKFYTDKDEERVLIYTPLSYVDWYLCSVVPPSVYTQGIGSYIYQSVALVAISAFLLFLIFFLAIELITRKKNREIAEIAFVDPITKGYTQPKFEIEIAKYHEKFKPYAFVSLDIKRFKLINDSFGSDGGNDVLVHIHRCIQDALKEGELLSRISADNFNILLYTIEKDEINARLEAIAEAINAFNAKREVPYYLPIVCGTYIVYDKDESLVRIRDRANTARKSMENHRERSLCTNVFYVDIVRLNMVKEKEIENSMEKALKEHEFVVYLQPKVQPSNGDVIAAEALIRWMHPEKGLIPPDEFIPLFEHNGFIMKLDLYVFEEVCKMLREWLDKGLNPVPVSINLSRMHLYRPTFLNAYAKIQENYQIPSKYLEIELTETVVFENLTLLKKVIEDIHRLGYRCSMDDFGSGYSSLNVLKEVPVDILKIDKIFFDSETNPRSNDVVAAIIQLAKRLGMETVAEGVETLHQLDLLRDMDCDMIQGYVYAKPMPQQQFEKLLKEDRTLIPKDNE